MRLHGAEISEQFSDPAAVQLGLMTQDPTSLGELVQRIKSPGDIPSVLAGMIEIDDLNRARKLLAGDVPDPPRAVAHDDLGEGAAPASVPSFQIQALAELGGVSMAPV